MRKNAYYLTLDAMIAIIIFSAGYLLVHSVYVTAPSSTTAEHISDDTLDVLNTAKASEFGISSMNSKSTILETIGEYYSRNKNQDSAAIIQKYVVDNRVVPANYGFSFYIDGNRIYPSNEPDTSKTKMMVSSKRIIFGYYEDSSTGEITFWGPYKVEVRTWQI
jgi:hypothetical protein